MPPSDVVITQRGEPLGTARRQQRCRDSAAG